MIDLAAAYRQLDAILAKHGLARWAYEVTITAWNHRDADGAATLGFTASAVGVDECIQAHQLSTLEAALEELDFRLAERARRAAGDSPADLTVALPGEAT